MTFLIKLTLCLLLVQLSFGRTTKLSKDDKNVEATTSVYPNKNSLQDFSTEYSNQTKKTNLYPAKKPIVSNDKLPHSVIPNTFLNVQRPSHMDRDGFMSNGEAKASKKHLIISLEFFNNMSSPGWIRHFQEKLQRIGEFFNYPNDPSSICQNLIARVQEKCHQLSPGPNASFFGTRPTIQHEYPFSYRNRKN